MLPASIHSGTNNLHFFRKADYPLHGGRCKLWLALYTLPFCRRLRRTPAKRAYRRRCKGHSYIWLTHSPLFPCSIPSFTFMGAGCCAFIVAAVNAAGLLQTIQFFFHDSLMVNVFLYKIPVLLFFCAGCCIIFHSSAAN